MSLPAGKVCTSLTSLACACWQLEFYTRETQYYVINARITQDFWLIPIHVFTSTSATPRVQRHPEGRSPLTCSWWWLAQCSNYTYICVLVPFQLVCTYLLLSGLSLIWIVLSSCTLPRRPAAMLELGTLKLLRLFRREQQVNPWGEEEREEEREVEGFTMDTSMQLVSYVFSSTNSWFWEIVKITRG